MTSDVTTLERPTASDRTPPAPIPKATDVLRPPQDWELLVTEGHVIGHRLVRVGRILFLPAMACGLVAVWLLWSALHGVGGGVALPRWVVEALTTNPDTYTVVPGGKERTSYQYAWLTQFRPQAGLSSSSWNSLVAAARVDVNKAGVKTEDYVELPKLQTQPLVTRPPKVYTEHVGKLAAGLVAIPAGADPAKGYVVAWVDGALAMVAFDQSRCATLFGPDVPGCVKVAGAIPNLAAFKPEGSK